jgi:hypothetical protein
MVINVAKDRKAFILWVKYLDCLDLNTTHEESFGKPGNTQRHSVIFKKTSFISNTTVVVASVV